MNREEPSRYVALETCDVLVDLLPIAGSDDEPARAGLQRGLRVWRTERFLDAARSPGWSRALYVPVLSEQRNAYANYAVLLTPKGAKSFEARGIRGATGCEIDQFKARAQYTHTCPIAIVRSGRIDARRGGGGCGGWGAG
jgi:hypothetical protein